MLGVDHGRDRSVVKLLFVTWDGPQVTYLESLFLPIFAGLGARGVHVDVLQFRWGEQALTDRVRAACEGAGIGYRPVRVARTFGKAGPFLTAFLGGRHVCRAVRDFGSDLIMPRSMMPAIAVMAAGGARLRPLVFDADGLAADERVEAADESRSSLTYRILRRVEAKTVRTSASVLVRTPAAADILARRTGVSPSRFHVVANGRDERLFHPGDAVSRGQIRAALGIAPDTPLILYLGSIGPKYRFDLTRQLIDTVARRTPNARLLILTGSPALATEALGPEPPLSPIVLRLPPEIVPQYVAAADLGLAFLGNSFSMQAVTSLKVAEYLMCGVPVFGTAAVGLTASAVEAGVFLDEGAGPDAAAEWLTTAILSGREDYRARARAVALKNFGLGRSIEDYLDALKDV